MTVIGAGFAGVEAAWGLAERGATVRLIEMRPAQSTPAHTTGYFAEFVCSNSLKSNAPTSPAGLLKEEMRALGSIVLKIAAEFSVPGGEALCVDRERFGQAISDAVRAHPRIDVVSKAADVDDVDEGLASGPVVIATGPLTTDGLSSWLAEITGRRHLYFYDAVSPTVDASTIDRSVAFAQSRYDKGGDDYLNCPMNNEEYLAFVAALKSAERVPLHAFEAGGVRSGDGAADGGFLEKVKYFAGCTPIEAIADGGDMSLAFGNFKPIGLTDPRTGRRPYAAIQLRPENQELSLYSLVACQNRLRFGEQKRVFRMVPGLQHAEFVRYGVIHRNTYVDAPQVLDRLELREVPGVFLAGQLCGVEGYVESAAMGIVAALRVLEPSRPLPPRETALGSLLGHLADPTDREFAPMNINWGLLPEPEGDTRDKALRKEKKLERARAAFSAWYEGALCPR